MRVLGTTISLLLTITAAQLLSMRQRANDRRLSLFLNVNDLFGTVRTGGFSVNPYNPSVSESTTDSRYVSFGLTWRLGRTEMETQHTHGKKEPRKKGK